MELGGLLVFICNVDANRTNKSLGLPSTEYEMRGKMLTSPSTTEPPIMLPLLILPKRMQP